MKVRFVLFQEPYLRKNQEGEVVPVGDGVTWTAVGLELYIVVSTPKRDDILREIEYMIEAEKAVATENGLNLVDDVGPAPAAYQKLWAAAHAEGRTLEVEVSI